MNTNQKREGYIIRFFRFLTQLFYQALGAGFIGRFFSAYQTSDRLYRRSYIGRVISHFESGGGRIYCAIRRGIALAIDRSPIRRGLKRLWYLICACSLRTVGLFFVTAGAYSVVAYCLFAFAWKIQLVGVVHLYIGIALLLLGFLLLFFDESLGSAMRRSVLLGKILLPALGFSEESFKEIPTVGKHAFFAAVPLGMLVGMLSALTSPVYILALALSLLVLFVVLASPEAGLMLLVLFLPFAGFLENGTLWLVFAAALPIISYLIKILRGNRIFTLRIEDFVLLLLVVVTVFSGASVAGAPAWGAALISALMMSLYFLTVNTVSTSRWLERTRICLLMSATLASLVGIGQFARAAFTATGGFSMAVLGTAVRAGFGENTTLAYFLVVVFPFALCSFLDNNQEERLFSGFACVAILATLALTWVQSAWLAVLIILVIFVLIRVKQAFPLLLLLTALCPFLLWLLPPSIRASIAAVLGADYAAAGTHRAALNGNLSAYLFGAEEPLFGSFHSIWRLLFGLGHGGVEQFCMLYTTIPPVAAAKSLNFWQYSLWQGGLLGVLLPALFFFLVLQSSFSLLRVGNNAQQPIWPAAGVGLIAGTLTMGFARYTWCNPAALAVFFIAVALVSADARAQRRRDEVVEPMSDADSSFAQIDYYKSH